MEEENALNRASVDQILGTPSFSRLLQSSILSAAEQPSDLKHELLSSIVSQRLLVEEESLLALCAPRAVDVVSQCSGHHLQVLGALFFFRRVAIRLDDESAAVVIFYENFSYYRDLATTSADAGHLASLGCLIPGRFLAGGLGVFLKLKFPTCTKPVNVEGHNDWERVVRVYTPIFDGSLTSVGQLIGVTVHEKNSGTVVNMRNWDA